MKAVSHYFRLEATRVLAGAAVALSLVSTAGLQIFAAPPVLSVFDSIAPSSASSNATAYDTNALNQISNRNGGSPTSFGTGPAAYSVTTSYTSNQIVFSQGHYNSWMGTADALPITATYGAAYANEVGNVLRFGLDVVGDGVTRFSLAQLSVTIFLNGNQFAATTGATFAPGTFRLFTLVGGMFVPTVGDANSVVDRIVYRGAGAGVQALDPTGVQTDQDALNETIQNTDLFYGSMPFTVSYAIVPEPGSIALSVVGSLGLLAVLRRRGNRRF